MCDAHRQESPRAGSYESKIQGSRKQRPWEAALANAGLGRRPWHRPLAIDAGAAPVPTPCGSKRGRDDLRARTGFGLDSHRAVPQTELYYVLFEIEYSWLCAGIKWKQLVSSLKVKATYCLLLCPSKCTCWCFVEFICGMNFINFH